MSRLVRESDGVVLQIGLPEGMLPVRPGGQANRPSRVMSPHVGLAMTLPLPDRAQPSGKV